MSWKKICLLALCMAGVHPMHAEQIQIVTIDSPLQHVLKTKTEDIQADELPLAQDIIDKLFMALEPYFPAAGLAAPQIGISKSVFLFSFDRDPAHLEGVINPRVEPCTDAQIEGWEGCFSVLLSNGIWKLAKLPRYETIRVQYVNSRGEHIERVLEGFAAKVFQHEYDHLQGIESVDREDAEIRDFSSQEEMMHFLQEVKKEDARRYCKPSI